MIEQRPDSFGAMFGLLTASDDLRLVVNPFETQLFHERIAVRDADRGVREIYWNSGARLRGGGGGADSGDDPCTAVRDEEALKACQPVRVARRGLADARRTRWRAVGLYVLALFVAAWPLAAMQRRYDADLPNDQSERSAPLVYYLVSCAMLAPVHIVGLALGFPGWTATHYLSWLLFAAYMLTIGAMVSYAVEKSSRLAWLGALCAAIGVGPFVYLMIAGTLFQDERANLDRAERAWQARSPDPASSAQPLPPD